MINTVYRLVAPRKFQIEFEDIPLYGNQVIVRPTYLSICHADQRYYQGLREQRVLEEKLPMALIHEGIGEVVYDGSGKFSIGDRVVMIPNTPPFLDAVIGENYMRGTRFRSSGYDGFLQEYIAMDSDRIISLPYNIPNQIAAYIELISVSIQAINRFEQHSHMRKEKIGVWGDGNLGYITSLLLKVLYPQAKIMVFGKTSEKLLDFSFVDETYLVGELSQDMVIDHAFECVGGSNAGSAINQIIEKIEPEGTISLMGVSEHEVGLNTRLVLEKGICLMGSSRSTYEDFKYGIEILQNHSDVVEYLERLVINVVEVSGVQQIAEVFEEDMKKRYGKTIIKWNA